jgi:pilus assembly protein CpaD
MTSLFGVKLRSCSDLGACRRVLLIGSALAALAAPLAGCGANKTVAAGNPSPDPAILHPIALVEQPYTTDLFPSHGVRGLDQRSADQVASFARRYRDAGRGPISIVIPRDDARRAIGPDAVEAIRRELARNGAAAPVTVSYYNIQNPQLASPVRLSFDGLKARVVHPCGDWPSDLASGSSVRGWENKPYWNFGCASQNMIATQVADPRDITEPRAESPADATMRIRGIGNVRKGADPGTAWQTKNSSIGSVGGN